MEFEIEYALVTSFGIYKKRTKNFTIVKAALLKCCCRYLSLAKLPSWKRWLGRGGSRVSPCLRWQGSFKVHRFSCANAAITSSRMPSSCSEDNLLLRAPATRSLRATTSGRIELRVKCTIVCGCTVIMSFVTYRRRIRCSEPMAPFRVYVSANRTAGGVNSKLYCYKKNALDQLFNIFHHRSCFIIHT